MVPANALASLLLLLAALTQPVAGPTSLTLWPGYIIELPPGHCVALDRRVDFDLVYFHDRHTPKGPVLVGIYAGHNPENLACPKPDTRQWDANGLVYKSARSAGGAPSSSSRIRTNLRGDSSTSGSARPQRITRGSPRPWWRRSTEPLFPPIAPITFQPASDVASRRARRCGLFELPRALNSHGAIHEIPARWRAKWCDHAKRSRLDASARSCRRAIPLRRR